jgi:PhzF family phenazine biosynthesis protein
MKTFKFKKIDAFTSGLSSGNPAGAVYLNSLDDINAVEMQQIARELKGFVSETGYVCRLDEETFNLRYYSSEREVDFCGHATVAIMYDLIKNSSDLISKDVVYINTSKGKLKVFNRIKKDDAVFISAPDPVFSGKTIDPMEIAEALRIDGNSIDGKNPISIINAGLETLIVPIKSLNDILSIKPDLDELRGFCIDSLIDIITVFTRETSYGAGDFRTRVFAPTFGYLEDPATGSGNSAFGYYLIKSGMHQSNIITIEQNGMYDNPNIVKLEFIGSENNQLQVSFGGNSEVRINGDYYLAS